MAAVVLTDQVANAAAGVMVCLTEQHADAPAVATAKVVLTEQHADEGGGSHAGVRLVEQSAVTAPTSYQPASMAVASGAASWVPRYIHTGSGSGTWN